MTVSNEKCYDTVMNWWPDSFLDWFDVVAPIVAIVTFFFAILQYRAAQRARTQDRRIEATKPFLELQLQLYVDATRSVAILAAPPSLQAKKEAHARFLQLYLGELALVEDGSVAPAMDAFRTALDHGANRETLEGLSLRLARACKDSVAKSWNTSAWQTSGKGEKPARTNPDHK